MVKFLKASEKKAFLFHEAFASFGEGMIGVFFPFLLMEVFNLGISEILYWMAGLFFGFVLLVYPVYRGLCFLSSKKFLQIGSCLYFLFYFLLALDLGYSWVPFVAMVFYSVSFAFYWPAYNWTITHTTKDGGRGGFLAWIQVLNVAIGMISPVIAGYLFSVGQQRWLVWVALVFFVLQIWVLQFLPDRGWTIPTFKKTMKILRAHFFMKESFKGHFVDVFQGRLLSMQWPLLLKFSLPGYVAFGAVKALSAFSEMVASRFVGRWIDHHSAKDVMQVGIWARFIDVGTRGLLFFLPTVWMASIINILAGILGPFFNVPVMGRVLERSENMPEEDMLAFYIAREWFLGFWSIVLFVVSALGYGVFGLGFFAGLLFFGGVMSFLCKDF